MTDLKDGIKYLKDYPCKEGFHEFQIIDIFNGICKCLYCPCQTTKVEADFYHKWKRDEEP